MNIEHEFLKRPEAEEKMYDDMEQDEADSDEDHLIDDL